MGRWRWLGFRVAVLATALMGCATEPVTTIPDPPPPAQASIAAAVVASALAEWQRWGRFDVRRSANGDTCAPGEGEQCEVVDDGCGREQAARWCAIVNEYWAQAFIGSGRWFFHDCSRTDICAWRWPAGIEPVSTPAWSAAFISAVMNRAGLDDVQFPRTPYHVDYVLAALDGPGAAYRVVPVPAVVVPGALICWRRLPVRTILPLVAEGVTTPPGPTASDADMAVATPAIADPIAMLRSSRDRRGPTPMHCDIVVEIDRASRRAWAIGGNVQQSVSRLAYPLDAEGRITADDGMVTAPLLVLVPKGE